MRTSCVLAALLMIAFTGRAAAQEFSSSPSPAPQPPGPPVTLRLEVEQTELKVGDFLHLRVQAVNDTPHGVIGFVPAKTIRVSTWPRGFREQGIVDDDFIGSVITLLPGGSRYVWGSSERWWSADVLQVTWDPGDYRLRYCTPIGIKLICTNTVQITVDE